MHWCTGALVWCPNDTCYNCSCRSTPSGFIGLNNSRRDSVSYAPSPSAFMTLRIESSATKSSGANVVIIPASAGFSKKNDTSYFGQYLVWFGWGARCTVRSTTSHARQTNNDVSTNEHVHVPINRYINRCIKRLGSGSMFGTISQASMHAPIRIAHVFQVRTSSSCRRRLRRAVRSQ